MDLLLAQASSSDTSSGVAVGVVIAWLAVFVIFIAAYWRLFEKAGEAGWKSLIPFYNVYVMLRIVGRPGWWLLLFFIPFVNFIVWIIVVLDLSRSYGKGVGFAIGLILLAPIFVLILAFGDSRYLGPAGPEPRPGHLPPPAPA